MAKRPTCSRLARLAGPAWLSAGALLLPGACRAPPPAPDATAPDAPIVIDGVIGDAEWAKAKRTQCAEGGELLVLRNAAGVSIAYRGPRQKVATVCVADGSRVRVLHASAALGEALYERDLERGWRLVRGFERWTRPDEGEQAFRPDQIESHLSASGWTATTLVIDEHAPASLEMSIGADALPPDARIAVAMIDFFDPARGAAPRWPAGLAADAVNTALLCGDAPQRAQFETTRWAPVFSPP